MTERPRCRVFPLGSVLLPGSSLPLHIFEARYHTMLADALADDCTFVVVLISRGSEVGGGETRTTVGTLARIEQHQLFDDGRAALRAIGQRRVEIVEWFRDDPYPMGLMAERNDADLEPEDSDRLQSALAAFERLIEAAERAGRLDRRPQIDWPDDIAQATWKLAQLVPMGPLDLQAVLESDRVGGRLDLIAAGLDEVASDLRRIAELD